MLIRFSLGSWAGQMAEVAAVPVAGRVERWAPGFDTDEAWAIDVYQPTSLIEAVYVAEQVRGGERIREREALIVSWRERKFVSKNSAPAPVETQLALL